MQYRNDGSREEYQIQNQFTAYLQVALKRRKNAYLSQRHRQQQHERPMEPEIYVVEEAELLHFLHENAKPGSNSVLVFDVFPEENLYLLSNDKD